MLEEFRRRLYAPTFMRGNRPCGGGCDRIRRLRPRPAPGQV